jgi:hypothetical protein
MISVGWRRLCVPLTSALGASFAWNSHQNVAFSEDKPTSSSKEEYMPSFSERMVGNYENRLRKFSSPERVFEYFSSVEIDKQFYMTREDFARAITPYTYRAGAQLASRNYKFNVKALAERPSKVCM